MQKKYQHLFITALKNYFKTEKRILKEGDLLAIPIDSSKSFFYYKENAGESGSNGGEVQEEEHDFECVLTTPLRLMTPLSPKAIRQGNCELTIGHLPRIYTGYQMLRPYQLP